jgi:hypothetical protein
MTSIVIFDAWGDWIVLGVLVLIVVGVILALYTRHGSEIGTHPRNQQRVR